MMFHKLAGRVLGGRGCHGGRACEAGDGPREIAQGGAVSKWKLPAAGAAPTVRRGLQAGILHRGDTQALTMVPPQACLTLDPRLINPDRTAADRTGVSGGHGRESGDTPAEKQSC